MPQKPLLLFIAEPMITVSQIPSWYWRSIGVLMFCVNERSPLIRNLRDLWGRDVDPSVVFISYQCIVLEVTCQQNIVYVASIYASTSYLTPCQLWDDLTLIHGRYHNPWLFSGDFNDVLGVHEKWDRRPPPSTLCMDFLNLSNANLLTHLPPLGSFLIWSNGRHQVENVSLQLDRAIYNVDWLNIQRRTSYNVLVRHQSDHHPLLISVDYSNVRHVVPFTKFKTWSTHEDCRRLVLENWSKNV